MSGTSIIAKISMSLTIAYCFVHFNYYLNRRYYIFFCFHEMRDSVINTLLHVCLQDLN